MKKSIITLLLTLIVFIKVLGQKDSCSHLVLSKSYLKQLDSSICIPRGYVIARIFNEDLDNNDEKDRIIKWFKKDVQNGDTIYYSIYSSYESGYKFFKTFSNLLPLYFDMASIDPEVVLKDSVLNSIKSRYINPQASEVEFKKGTIIIQFQLTARDYQKLYFSFYEQKKTFILTKAEYYKSERTDGLYKELKKTEIFKMHEGLDIVDFNYLNFLY